MGKPLVCVSGFSQFLDYPENPTALLLPELNAMEHEAFELKTTLLETSYEHADRYVDAMLNLSPDVIIMLGQSAKAKGVTLEQYAKNQVSQTINDVDNKVGQLPGYSNKPAIYKSAICVDSLHRSIRNKVTVTVPIVTSQDAGDYVCNYIYYKTLDAFQDKNCKVLFIHIPFFREQRDDLNAEALKDARACALEKEDIFATIYRMIETIIQDILP